MLLVLVLVVAGLLLRAWHFRRAFRAELAHARRTGAPEPVYRNPFLGGYLSSAPGGAETGAVPVLWDEEMLEPSSELDIEKDMGAGAEMGTGEKGTAPRLCDQSEQTCSTLCNDDAWSLTAVQPASLARYAYAPARRAGAGTATLLARGARGAARIRAAQVPGAGAGERGGRGRAAAARHGRGGRGRDRRRRADRHAPGGEVGSRRRG